VSHYSGYSLLPGSCDFEHDLCGMTNSSGDFYWRRFSGATPTNFTGPSTDHTLGTKEGNNNPFTFLIQKVLDFNIIV